MHARQAGQKEFMQQAYLLGRVEIRHARKSLSWRYFIPVSQETLHSQRHRSEENAKPTSKICKQDSLAASNIPTLLKPLYHPNREFPFLTNVHGASPFKKPSVSPQSTTTSKDSHCLTILNGPNTASSQIGRPSESELGGLLNLFAAISTLNLFNPFMLAII